MGNCALYVFLVSLMVSVDVKHHVYNNHFCVMCRWVYLQVETYDDPDIPDYVQAYGAGAVEGMANSDLVSMHWTNILAGYCPKPYSKFCARLSFFLEQNLKWMKEQIKANKARSVRSPFWHQVSFANFKPNSLFHLSKNLTGS